MYLAHCTVLLYVQGDHGAVGLPGPQGAPGAKGPAGVPGEKGETGARGEPVGCYSVMVCLKTDKQLANPLADGFTPFGCGEFR